MLRPAASKVFASAAFGFFGIDQDGNDRRLGVQQPEQLDAFGSELAVDEGNAGDVAARTG